MAALWLGFPAPLASPIPMRLRPTGSGPRIATYRRPRRRSAPPSTWFASAVTDTTVTWRPGETAQRFSEEPVKKALAQLAAGVKERDYRGDGE